jgi:CheY-like chemotaxis protein
MATKRVLSVGQCAPDQASLVRFFKSHFDVAVESSRLPADTLEILRRGGIDLVVINRKLDEDYTDGLETLKAIKADPQLAGIPVMIVSNYPEAHEEAIQHGGEYGFGKLELQRPETIERVRPFLEQSISAAG